MFLGDTVDAPCSAGAQSAKEFVWNVLRLDQNLACKVSLLLWKWWGARNKVNAGDPIQRINSLSVGIRAWECRTCLYQC